jgi:hypothetical protein
MNTRLRSVEERLTFIESRLLRAEQWVTWIVELISSVFSVTGKHRTDCKSGISKFPCLAANLDGNAFP